MKRQQTLNSKLCHSLTGQQLLSNIGKTLQHEHFIIKYQTGDYQARDKEDAHEEKDSVTQHLLADVGQFAQARDEE